jgi:hypothetical protein
MHSPINIVQISIIAVFAVFANLSTTPASFSRFPKNRNPSRIAPAGAMIEVMINAAIGNKIFSLRDTTRGVFMRMIRSEGIVRSLITGG